MRWFAGAVFLLLIALVFNLGLLAYAMYALLGAIVISRVLTRIWAESLTADRECNRYTAQIGETVAVVITVQNRGWLPIPWVLLEDLLPRHALLPPPPRLRVEGRRLQLVMLHGHGRKTILYQLHCQQRGYFQIGPLVLETGDVFGLHRRYRVVTSPHYLLVYPEVVPLEGYEISSRRPLGEIRMSYRLYEDPTRIAGVRQYMAGDPLNRVHWRATARAGSLHSKVYEPSSMAGATIVLDFHQSSYVPKDEPYRSELAVTTAASLAHALYHMGQQVGLVTNGRDTADRIRQEGWDSDARSRRDAQRAASMLAHSDRLRPVVVETRQGQEQLMRILETLARVELTDGLSFVHLLEETASRLPHNATVLAILTVVAPETAVALGNLRRKGFAVSVLVNVYHIHDFERAASLLSAHGIEARYLRDRESVAVVCRNFILGKMEAVG